MKLNKKTKDLIYHTALGDFKIESFFSLTAREQDIFVRTIFKSRAHFLIYKLLKKHKKSLAYNNLYKKAKYIVNLSSLHSIIHIEESHRVNKILNDNKISFLFLKGVHLINSYYDDLIERPIRDIDILVRREDINRAISILLKNGYRFEYDVDESSLEYFFNNSYDIPVLIGKNGSRLEVHFSIENTTLENDCIFTKRFFKDSKKIKYGNSYTQVLSTEDLILHLIYHGLKKSGPNVGIIFISDIFKVLISKGYDNSILIQKAKTYNLIPHLKMVVDILCSKSDNKKLHKLNKEIDFRVQSKIIKSLDFLLIRNDVFDEEVKLFQLIKKFKFKKIIKNYNSSTLRREYNIDREQNIKILFSYLLRITRHLKIITFFILRIVFLRSVRLQLYKIKTISAFINDF